MPMKKKWFSWKYKGQNSRDEGKITSTAACIWSENRVIHGYQYFSPREWKIIELQTKREGLDIELFTKEQERVLGDTCILIQILQFYLL